jgi:hypothetical protein
MRESFTVRTEFTGETLAPVFKSLCTAGLTEKESRSLSYFREPKGLVQLCNETSLADFHVCHLVWVLLTIGAITRIE